MNTVLPYNGTEGHSGSDTSRQRAEYRVASGLAASNQEVVLDTLVRMGKHGLTSKEVETILRSGHGTASGVLSNLHKAGYVQRLQAIRGRQAIYVLPDFVEGRDTSEYGRGQARQHVQCPSCDHKFTV